MKFSAGAWRDREGVHAFYPAEAYEIRTAPDSLTVYAPCRRIGHRADTLDGTLLSLRFSSPMPGIIRVQAWHDLGASRPGPAFNLAAAGETAAKCLDTPGAAVFASGELSVRVAKGDAWSFCFCHGEREITRSGQRAMGYVLTDAGGRYMREQLALGIGECLYGLGERFTPFVKNGQTVDIWQEDGGTCSELSYKNVPFYLSNRGYGVFVNHPERVSFELATERVARAQFSVAGEYLDYFIIDGPSPKEVLTRYTALTGRPALPPAWSFGLWLSTSFTTSYDEKTVTSFVDGMAQRDLPLHVFHFDCFWMREFHWCDFIWDERQFPDPAGMLKRLKERGLKICVWINPYISQLSALFQEGAAGGYLLKKENGDVWQKDQWQPGLAMVDFTNPEARAWYAAKLKQLLAMGVDCLKTDFGERIPTDAVYHDGSDPQKMHNYYTYLYNQTVFTLLEKERGRGDAVVFARSATAGSQCFPVHWGGDCTAEYESMAESLRGGLSLGLCGFGFWSHDIGGFNSTATADLYKRWLAFGLLSSHSRLHGDSSYRVPWNFDEEAVEVARFFTKLKCRLMPYLYGAAVEAAGQGLPVLRAMMLEFPEDPACAYLDRQYLLGSSLLVAPVFNAGGDVDYYLPAGTWTHFLNGSRIEGGGWRREKHDYLSLPIMARPGSLIPEGREEQRPDYDLADGVTLHLFDTPGSGQAYVSVPNLKGEAELNVTARWQDGRLELEAAGAGKPWSLLWHHAGPCASAQQASCTPEAAGLRIIPSAYTGRVTVVLQGR